MKEFEQTVRKYLTFTGSCYRHCKKETSFFRIQNEQFVGAYLCPERYVPRVVYFDIHPDLKWFRDFIAEQVGENRVRQRDIRTASRYGWELGGRAVEKIALLGKGTPSIKEVYWTHPRDEEKMGTFLCDTNLKGCGRLFTKEITSKETLCPRCRTSLS